jgi:hypothetical protein
MMTPFLPHRRSSFRLGVQLLAAPCVLQAVRFNCTEAACAAAVCMYILDRYMTSSACRDPHEEARQALKAAHRDGTECQICHAVVSYVRAALANDETKEEIELVRLPAAPSLALVNSA